MVWSDCHHIWPDVHTTDNDRVFHKGLYDCLFGCLRMYVPKIIIEFFYLV